MLQIYIIYLLLEKLVLSGLLPYIQIYISLSEEEKVESNYSKRNLRTVSFYCSRFKDSSYSINTSWGILRRKHAINLPAF